MHPVGARASLAYCDMAIVEPLEARIREYSHTMREVAYNLEMRAVAVDAMTAGGIALTTGAIGAFVARAFGAIVGGAVGCALGAWAVARSMDRRRDQIFSSVLDFSDTESLQYARMWYFYHRKFLSRAELRHEMARFRGNDP